PRAAGAVLPALAVAGVPAGCPGLAVRAVRGAGDAVREPAARRAPGCARGRRVRAVVGAAVGGELRLPRGLLRRPDAGLHRRTPAARAVAGGGLVRAAAGAGQG